MTTEQINNLTTQELRRAIEGCNRDLDNLNNEKKRAAGYPDQLKLIDEEINKTNIYLAKLKARLQQKVEPFSGTLKLFEV